MQIQADLLQSTVVRPDTTETTALGAAFLQALPGYWNTIDELKTLWKENKRFSPQPQEKSKRAITLWENRIQKIIQ